MSDQVQDFLDGLAGKAVLSHKISPPFSATFTICGTSGWCGEDDSYNCPDCRAIEEGRASRLPRDPWE